MTGNINPDREQFEAFKALPRDRPVNMLNLVRVKEIAVYPDGTKTSAEKRTIAMGNSAHRFSTGLAARSFGAERSRPF